MAGKQRKDSNLALEAQTSELATITARIDYADLMGHGEPSIQAEDARKGRSENGDERHVPLATLILLATVASGIQFGWALQLSLLTPYIQTLGIEHAFSSFIWLCGPITGLVVQPCVGIWSDKCTSKWGRRRPFILAGALLVIVSVIIIGFSADIGYLLGDTDKDCHLYQGSRPRAAFIFVLGFWLLDVANNTVQSPARALLADLAGPEQRDGANATFVLWMAFGNVLGFATGASGQWHKLFPFLTSKACCEACANLKAAFIIAVIFLAICTAVTLLSAHEIPLVQKEHNHKGDAAPLLFEEGSSPTGYASIIQDGNTERQDPFQCNGSESEQANEQLAKGRHYSQTDDTVHDLALSFEHKEGTNRPGSVLINLLVASRQLPASMKSVLWVMGLCWLSWFPFFLFDTDWMGREVYQGDPSGDASSAASYEAGVRMGALGLLLNSVVLGISSLFIDPLCRRIGSKYLWSISNFIVFVSMASTTIITTFAVDLRVVDGQRVYVHPQWVKVAAVILFTVLGFPLAVTYSVPYSITAELTTDSGTGQGLAMGILNLAVVLPQMVVALGAGPWDALFGGGNEPAFALASIFALLAAVFAATRLPQLSKRGYRPTVVHFG